MIQAYYDIEKKDSFHTTFKDTWIVKQPTEKQGKYQVLFFDFSKAAAEKTDWRRTSMPIAKPC